MSIIETTHFSFETLCEMVRMAAESAELDKHSETDNFDNLEPTLPLKALFEAFEVACLGALHEFFMEVEGVLKEGVTIEDLMAAEGPFLILMTLEGHGVGIWDGSWDEFFVNPKKDIEELSNHLQEALGYFADISGAGAIPEALETAAKISLGLDPWE